MPAPKHTFGSYINIRLERVALAARNAADRVYRREFGMDIQQIRILRIVFENPGRPVSWIVRESNLDRTLVSRIISSLVAQKLVERTISPDDARQFLVTTTPNGEERVQQANTLGDALNLDLLSVLDRNELETLERCLHKLAQWKPCI